jgi:hypothetical protein
MSPPTERWPWKESLLDHALPEILKEKKEFQLWCSSCRRWGEDCTHDKNCVCSMTEITACCLPLRSSNTTTICVKFVTHVIQIHLKSSRSHHPTGSIRWRASKNRVQYSQPHYRKSSKKRKSSHLTHHFRKFSKKRKSSRSFVAGNPPRKESMFLWQQKNHVK